LVECGSYGTVHKGTFNEKVVALKRIPIPPGTEVYKMIVDNQEIAALRYHYNTLISNVTAYSFIYNYIE